MHRNPAATPHSNEVRERLLAIQSFLAVVRAGRTGPLNELQQSFLDTAFNETKGIEPLIDRIDQILSKTDAVSQPAEPIDAR